MAWDVLCNYLDLEFCFRKEEAAQQVHKLLISAVARVDYCNHSHRTRMVEPCHVLPQTMAASIVGISSFVAIG